MDNRTKLPNQNEIETWLWKNSMKYVHTPLNSNEKALISHILYAIKAIQQERGII